MTISTVTNLSTLMSMKNYLQSEESTATDLGAQLASGVKHGNLTDYSAADAMNLLNLQSAVTQSQSYLTNITTVQSRLSGYDNTMTDMESIVSQAQTLAAGNGNYNVSGSSSITTQANNFLKSVELDLNQTINGRYIYAGARYTTQPVADLTSLGAPTTAIYTDNSTLPDYDTSAAATALTTSIAGQNVTFGGTAANSQSASVTVSGKTYTYAVSSTDTPTTIAAGLATLVAADIPGTTSAAGVLTIGGAAAPTAATTGNTSVAAYAADQATISTGYALQYGVTSDNPAFQKLISGLRFLAAAGSSTDAATYKSNITQATTFLTSALSSLQSVHTSVAGNQNILTNEKTTQSAAIDNLTGQVDDISQVNTTQVAAEITALETQLQASYSATGILEKMSIVSYL